jgi:hypothetical protein
MQLRYKDDWEETQQRYKAWWARENFGRCALAVTAPRDGVPDEPPPERPPSHADPEVAWRDLDYHAAANDHYYRRTFFGGEAFPKWDCGYPGHKGLTAFLGANVTLQERTGWVEPIWTGDALPDEVPQLDEANAYFQFALAEQERAVKEAAGNSVPGIVCAFGGCGDTLAGLRGTERLLYDLMDTPDQVRHLDLALMDVWIAAYERFYQIAHDGAEGSTTWFPVWSPGKGYATQNDFAYMISPQQFRDVFLPSIEKQLDYLDHAVHHLDGIGNFVHADALCELPRLDAIQVLPGAGKPSALHYMPLLKRIQAAGKGLHIWIGADEIETALGELSARGLFISTRCDTEAEARDLLKKAEKWSTDGRWG